MKINLFACRLGTFLVFSFSIFPSIAQQEDAISLIRERLIKDALEERGFVDRVKQYMMPDLDAAGSYQQEIMPDGSWSDVDYLDTDNEWDPLKALNRTLVMAYAYAELENSFYKNEKMLESIENALSYWYQVNPVCKNWYKNDLAKQMYLGVIALLLQDDISPFILKRMIEDQTEEPRMTGSNRTLFATSVFYRGVLERDPQRISAGVQGVLDQVGINQKEGVQQDYSFHQHGPYLYNGSYGNNFLRETIWMAAMVQGTPFAFKQEDLAVMRDYYLQGTRWMVYRGLMDYNVRGRQVGRPSGFDQRAEILLPQLAYFMQADPDHRKEFAKSQQKIIHKLPQIEKGHKHFWRSDYTVHHRGTFFTSLRMCSDRTIGVETDVNSENLLGYYLPYGLTYIYRNGDEYEDIFPVWDWAKLPGVTSPDKVYPLIKGAFTQPTQFVGGVSDGHFGVSVMDLEVHELTGKKAWFWFDNEWIALGAGITSTGEDFIQTGINQTRLKGNILVNGKPLVHQDAVPKDASWVWHDSVGYFFPGSPDNLHISGQEQTGQMHRIYGLGENTHHNMDVFSLWLSHGSKPENATYAYAVIPGISGQGMEEYVKDFPFEILVNTGKVQAIYHNKLQLTGVVFHESIAFHLGESLILEPNHPCLVLINHKTSTFTVSDPTATHEHIELIVKDATDESQRIIIDLPSGLDAGKSVSIPNSFLATNGLLTFFK
ncbi:polysaccharide lyase 8 family protein [Lunatibacter salilacus]|uniref:polysaccharide lyase 8 family protein n=1 Tax=Lunatibacter salilacus TaxID=2483804 RepID=UPI00131C8482|nr:polysaccharide lyase 8 family protein [Lunatibacter salilacus]